LAQEPGAVWDDLNYHQSGDGNLRGYAAGSFGVNRLVALNLEAGSRLPLFALETLVRRSCVRFSWYGSSTRHHHGREQPIKSSGRVGALSIRFSRLGADGRRCGIQVEAVFPFWDLTLRLDIPVWINHPEITANREDPVRYLFAIDGLLTLPGFTRRCRRH